MNHYRTISIVLAPIIIAILVAGGSEWKWVAVALILFLIQMWALVKFICIDIKGEHHD